MINQKSYLLLLALFFFLPLVSLDAGAGESPKEKHGVSPSEKGITDDMNGKHGGMKMNNGENMRLMQDIAMGKMIYEMSCIFCHGAGGKGDGPAAVYISPYSSPRPRDFYHGVFKFRSTKSGNLPTEFDLMRTVRDGIPGFMPSFRYLGRERLRQVALYVSQFYKRITEWEIRTSGKAYEEMTIDHSVAFTMESIRRGQEAYEKLGCASCHGKEGRGDGPSAKTLKDEKGFPIAPTDLTLPSTFKNGNDHEDIYRTLMTGLSGTPMPSYADSIKMGGMKAWDLVHYILSLSPDDEWMRIGRTK